MAMPVSEPGSGTEIELVIPGSVAYAKAPAAREPVSSWMTPQRRRQQTVVARSIPEGAPA